MRTTETPQAVKEVAAQIERILGNHDLVGCIIIGNRDGHTGRLLVLDASWTAFESTANQQVRLMDEPEEPILQDDYNEKMARTVGFIAAATSELQEARETLMGMTLTMAKQAILGKLSQEARDSLSPDEDN